MSRFKRATAEALDTAASNLNAVGQKVAGKTGGRVGDAIATAALAPIRGRIDVNCTNCDRGTCNHR